MIKRASVLFPVVALTLGVMPAIGTAATLVNFESGYSDNQVLGDGERLLDSNGNLSKVRISTVNDNTMSVEASGGADGGPQGFLNDRNGVYDSEAGRATSSLDGFFLRSTKSLRGDLSKFNPVFSLSFMGGASSVNAEIWDIDGNTSQGSEGWEVIATFKDGSTSSILSPTFMNTYNHSSLNGQAWGFSFDADGSRIMSLDFLFNGTKTRGIGVAFDNLTVSPVPLPAAGLMLLASLGALGALGRRRKS